MRTIQTPRFKILVAEHSGMCFGVKKALAATERLLRDEPTTILGELAHNPAVKDRMTGLGAKHGELEKKSAPTQSVVFTAHGVADADRRRWKEAGYRVLDTTCPLVHVAHRKLGDLVEQGYYPVVIGKADHVEVRGLMGDFPNGTVILEPEDIAEIPPVMKLGLISQTTQPIDKVQALVDEVRKQRPHAEVVFQDTVCRPTKDRQRSLHELALASEVVLAIGGKNSNNTAQLARTAANLGCRAYHITDPQEICPQWFHGMTKIGVTAGTSTLDESIEEIIDELKLLGQSKMAS